MIPLIPPRGWVEKFVFEHPVQALLISTFGFVMLGLAVALFVMDLR